MLKESGGMGGCQLTDVCPFSLGTSIINKNDSSKDFMSTMIPRNSILPCSKVHNFVTAHDFQKKCQFDILQGEEIYARDNIFLGKMEVDVIPKPKGAEKILVRFSDDEEDREEEKRKQRQKEESEEIVHCSHKILEGLRQILDRGPGYERAAEIHKFLEGSPEGFIGGNPEIYNKKKIYVLQDDFISSFYDLCDDHDIDRESYKEFLKLLYPGDGSDTVTRMRGYLLGKQRQAYRRPLKKMNYLLAFFLVSCYFDIIFVFFILSFKDILSWMAYKKQ